jgi:hypothetical protein
VYKAEEPPESQLCILMSHATPRENGQGYACSGLQLPPVTGVGKTRPATLTRLAKFFSSALDFCFQSSVSQYVLRKGINHPH